MFATHYTASLTGTLDAPPRWPDAQFADLPTWPDKLAPPVRNDASMNLADTIVGLIRTSVLLGVGAVVSWLATLGLVLRGDTEPQLTSALTAIVAAALWALVTWALKRWPSIG